MNSLLLRRTRLSVGLLTLLLSLMSALLGLLVGTSLKMFVFALVLGTVVMLLYIANPLWMIAISLTISPYLDQTADHTLSGVGFNLASLVRGASVIAMILTMRNRNEGEKKPWYSSWMDWGTLILIIPLCLSLPLAYNSVFSLKQTLALAYWALFFLYLTRKLQTKRDARVVTVGLFMGAVLIITTMAPYEIHQVYSTYTNGSMSIYGPYNGGPFNLALSVAFWTPTFFILRTKGERIVYAMVLILLMDILLHTFVRTGILVVLIFLVYTILGNHRYRRAGFTVLAVIAAGMMFHNVQSGWLHRIHQANTLNGLSSGRLLLYQVAIQRFFALDPIHKIVGIGFGNSSVIMVSISGVFHTDPQNDFLNTLLSAGVLGLIGLVIYLVVFFRKICLITEKHHRNVAQVVFLAILFVAMINGVYSGETTAMIFAMATIGLTRFYGSEQQPLSQIPVT